MEPRDYLAIGVSVLAIVVSIIALIVSTRKKDKEDERMLRLSLNEVIGKIIASRVDQAKYFNDHPIMMANTPAGMVQRLLAAQISAFSRLASDIAVQIPHLVTDVEYATIASSLGATGDQHKAMEFWDKAVKTSKERFYEVKNRQDFAVYLFAIGELEKGRDEFKKTLSIASGGDDISKYMTGYTYMLQGMSERAVAYNENATRYFGDAQQAFNTISNSAAGQRAAALADLAQFQLAESNVIPKLVTGAPSSSPSPQIANRWDDLMKSAAGPTPSAS
jgi:tetratricopeptide (TPR) repeat protein